MIVRVDGMDWVQQRMQVNHDLATKALEQVLIDQSTLSRQIQATGQAVAKLTMERMQDDYSDAGSLFRHLIVMLHSVLHSDHIHIALFLHTAPGGGGY